MAKAPSGIIYERNTYSFLSKIGVLDTKIGYAGSGADIPDVTFRMGNKTAGVELKNNMSAAAGSLVLKYWHGAKFWDYGDDDGKPEKLFLKKIGDEYRVLDKMNGIGQTTDWSRAGPPAQQNDDSDPKKKIWVKPNSTYAKASEYDKKRFSGSRELYISTRSDVISNYYVRKKTYYFNLGNWGFYTFGNIDPLGLNGLLAKEGMQSIPNFTNAHSAQIRVRYQSKGTHYQFTMELDFKNITKSPYNIAPIRSGSKEEIDEKAFHNNKFRAIIDKMKLENNRKRR